MGRLDIDPDALQRRLDDAVAAYDDEWDDTDALSADVTIHQRGPPQVTVFHTVDVEDCCPFSVVTRRGAVAYIDGEVFTETSTLVEQGVPCRPETTDTTALANQVTSIDLDAVRAN